MDTPVSAQQAEHLNCEGTKSDYEPPFATTLDAGRLFLVSEEDSVLVLDSGFTANLVCFRWLEHRNRLLEEKGCQKASPDPSAARVRFGDGRLGEVRRAADILVGIAGKKGIFAAFASDAGAPAL